MQKNWYKKLAQKTEHPTGLNKWGSLRVSNVLRPDNRVAGPWVGWAHSGVCSVGGRAQWPWRVLRTAGAAGARVYFWARVRWVLGSSGVGAFCVRARLGSCCAGVFLLSSGPCCVARILGAVGRPPIYACGLGIWRRGVFCVCLGSLWGVFCVLLWAVPGTAGPLVCVVICGRVFCGCLGVVASARSACGFGFILFVMRNSPLFNFNRIFPPPFPERAETLRRNLLFEGTMLMR